MLAFRRVSEIIKFHEELDHALRNDPTIRDIHRLYDSLTVKAASLFQHQSIMIAVCVFLSNISETNRYIKIAYLAETFTYMIFCCIMLPMLNVSTYDSPPEDDGRRAYFARSVRRRVNLLTISLHATIVLTLVVICTLAIDLYFLALQR
jgi:hypothetical protein